MFYFDEEAENNGEWKNNDDPAAVGGGATTAERKTTSPPSFSSLEKDNHPHQQLKQAQHPDTQHPQHHHHHHNSNKNKNNKNKMNAPTRNFHDIYQLRNDDLGSGAYATVRTAVHRATGREYAVKLVDKHEPGHTRSRIAREIEIFTMCRDHPNIVQLQEWFEDDHNCYMVFEKVYGGPLLKKIQQKVCFTEHEASLVTRDIASALKFLHMKGIAHRDVKPENILCIDRDGVSPVKLCDLDLASKPMTSKKSKRGLHVVQSEPNLASPVGSAEFMAPEVVDAFVGEALKYDKRCDLWSLGVIIYIMLCGYPPFYGECERENCGWDQGMACADCQENLFHRIQAGLYQFPPEEWANISNEAKELISHLLVRDVRLRYTADDVLKHPWVKNGAPRPTVLQTPAILSRNDSTREIQQMNEHFNVVNRFTSTCCLDLGSDGSEVSSSANGSIAEVSSSSSSSGDGTPDQIASLANSPGTTDLLLEEMKTPMPTTDGEEDPKQETPSPPIYIEQHFNYNGGDYARGDYNRAEHPQQLIEHNGVFYCTPPPALCSQPVGLVGPPPLNMYINGCPSMSTYYGQQQQMMPVSAQGAVQSQPSSQMQPLQQQQQQQQHLQQQLFYPTPSAFCYYVFPPPADMVNA